MCPAIYGGTKSSSGNAPAPSPDPTPRPQLLAALFPLPISFFSPISDGSPISRDLTTRPGTAFPARLRRPARGTEQARRGVCPSSEPSQRRDRDRIPFSGASANLQKGVCVAAGTTPARSVALLFPHVPASALFTLSDHLVVAFFSRGEERLPVVLFSSSSFSCHFLFYFLFFLSWGAPTRRKEIQACDLGKCSLLHSKH